MRSLKARDARRLSSERGFTLIELLVAMALSLFIGAAAMTFMVVTFQQQNTIQSRTVATTQAEAGLEQLVRDLREAITFVTVTNPTTYTTQIKFDIPTPGSDTSGELVSWTCPSTSEAATFLGTCTRALTTTGGTTTAAVINSVQSMSFSPLSSSNVTLSLPVTSSTSVASVGMTLTVQIGSYGLTTTPTAILRGPGTSSSTPSTAPIVLQATADLRNFG